MKKILFRTVIFLLLATTGFAQRDKEYAEFGVFGGGSYYLGDLNPLFHFRQTKLAGGAFVRYNFNSRFAARLNAFYGNVLGNDALSKSEAAQQRNLSFQSSIMEVAAQIEFNFLDFKVAKETPFTFSPYIFVGVGGFKFNPKTLDGIELQPLGTEGQGLPGGPSKRKYRLIQPCIPFGIGAKMNLTKSIGLSLEWGLRKTFTDYLDDVSTRYYASTDPEIDLDPAVKQIADKSTNTDPAYDNAGRQRGNSTTKDWYSFAGISLTFRFGSQKEVCPHFD